MTYNTGSNILASDYNTFATAAASVNEVFADMHSGATSLPDAGYGYGQTALTSVSAGNPILASEWNALFTAMRSCGTHQGTTVVPPLPSTGPVAGDVVAAVTTDAGFATLVSNLRTNRFVIAPAQTSLITGTTYSSSTPWTTSLVYTTQIDFGSWNNARYFFNSGGSVVPTGSYSSTATPDELSWHNALINMSLTNFSYNSTTNATGNEAVSPPGFYGLTTSYQTIYLRHVGGAAYYVGNYVKIEAKLNAAAGTNGKVDMRITLIDADTFPVTKTGTTAFSINRYQTSAPIVYPGSFVVTNGGFVVT